MVDCRSNGEPIASTHSPSRSPSELPNGMVGEILALDLDERHVRRGVGADHLGVELAAVVELHAQLRGVFDHVVVRHDISVVGDDDARTAGTALLRLRLAAAATVALRNAEEFEEGVVGASAVTRRDVDLLDRFDVHDRFDRILGRIGQIGIFIGFVGRKVRTEGGRTFDLAFDIFDFVGVRAVYRPHRYAARDGRNCNRS